MAEQLIPPWIIPEEESQEWLDEGSAVFASQFAPGLTQRQSYGGLRLKLSRKHTVRGEEKARLLSILNQTRGRFNAVRTKVHFASRGSGLGGELLTNNTFDGGTTGWQSGATSVIALSATDRSLRATQLSGASGSSIRRASPATTVAYAPYAFRAHMRRSHVWSLAVRIGTSSGGTDIGDGAIVNDLSSLQTVAGVSPSTSIYSSIATAVAPVGHYVDVSYTSLSRCALVDNGPNLLLRSSGFDASASWTTVNASVIANSQTDPWGGTTADSLVDTSTDGAHQLAQSTSVSAAVADHFFAVAMKAGSVDWGATRMVDGGGSAVSMWFNLASGTKGNVAVGANWANARTFMHSLGDGWYYCGIVARKNSANTSVDNRILSTTADGSLRYSGAGTAAIHLDRATRAQSGVPTRLVETTSAATSGTAQTGNALHLKGLEASEDGLLLPGDWFEINGELKQATAALNSDAAGLGYLQFEPDLVRSPADNDPVILTDPMGKFLVSNIKIDNQFGTQAIVTYDLEHIYD